MVDEDWTLESFQLVTSVLSRISMDSHHPETVQTSFSEWTVSIQKLCKHHSMNGQLTSRNCAITYQYPVTRKPEKYQDPITKDPFNCS